MSNRTRVDVPETLYFMGDKYSMVHVEKSLESIGTVNNMRTPNACEIL